MSDELRFTLESARAARTRERAEQLEALAGKDETATLVSYAHADADALAKRLHEVKGAVRKFALIAETVRKGYRFDDENAAGVLATLDGAIATLEDELLFWQRVYP